MRTATGTAAQMSSPAPRIATLSTDLFRNELFLARTPPSGGAIEGIIDDVFLPLVRPR
jgi:hypothetical protein